MFWPVDSFGGLWSCYAHLDYDSLYLPLFTNFWVVVCPVTSIPWEVQENSLISVCSALVAQERWFHSSTHTWAEIGSYIFTLYIIKPKSFLLSPFCAVLSFLPSNYLLSSFIFSPRSRIDFHSFWICGHSPQLILHMEACKWLLINLKVKSKNTAFSPRIPQILSFGIWLPF